MVPPCFEPRRPDSIRERAADAVRVMGTRPEATGMWLLSERGSHVRQAGIQPMLRLYNGRRPAIPRGASSAPVGSLLTGPFGGSASAGFHHLRLAGNWRAPAYFILIAASYDMLLL